MKRKKPQHIKIISRNLRSNLTDAEQHLWSRLRSRQLRGMKFRRQHPVGEYIVDFACLEIKLIIEIDGGQHSGDKRDEIRDSWLDGEGFKILRYWNNQVLNETDAVVEDILLKADSPSP